jgi:hypothetical protein
MSLQRLAAVSCACAALLAAAGFTALGSVFAYPQILEEPADEILALYREHQGAVGAWFGVLIVAAALLAPAAVALGRLAGGRRGRWIAGVGVAAAVVQVIGLSRWPLLIPGYAAAGDTASFTTAHHVLGTLIGETLGYALTAAWTVLVLAALGRTLAGRWFTLLGGLAAALIATGVLAPLSVPGVDMTNFIGYVLFSLWLIAFAVVLVRRPALVPATATAR